MKKTLQRMSKLVMAVLLFCISILFSGCFIEKISPYTRPRFFHFEGTWVCDTEEFKMSIETINSKEYKVFGTLAFNGEEIEAFIEIGGPGSSNKIWVYERELLDLLEEFGEMDENTPQEVREEYRNLYAKYLIFNMTFDNPYFKKAEEFFTVQIVNENPEYVGEKTFVGKEYVLYRQGD